MAARRIVSRNARIIATNATEMAATSNSRNACRKRVSVMARSAGLLCALSGTGHHQRHSARDSGDSEDGRQRERFLALRRRLDRPDIDDGFTSRVREALINQRDDPERDEHEA